MKLCFFSDIHGNGSAFDAFVREMEVQKTDRVIFGGDFCGYYYDTLEIIDKVRTLGYSCIRGNHDQMLLNCLAKMGTEEGVTELERLVGKYGNTYRLLVESIDAETVQFLESLPLYEEMEVDGKNIGFFHGSPRNPLEDRIYPDSIIEDTAPFSKYDYVFCGHTHHKLVKIIGQTTLINPGSAGQQRDGKGTAYVLFDTETGIFQIKSFAYDKKRVELKIEQYDADNPTQVQRLKEVLYRKPRQY